MGSSPVKTTIKQNNFILAMLQSENIDQAAKFAKVAPSTARRWMGQPFMQARLKEAQKQAFEKALRHLQVAAIDAAVYLHLTVKNKDVADSVRVRAAGMILEHATSSHVIEQFERRIAQLEQALQDQNQSRRSA